MSEVRAAGSGVALGWLRGAALRLSVVGVLLGVAFVGPPAGAQPVAEAVTDVRLGNAAAPLVGGPGAANVGRSGREVTISAPGTYRLSGRLDGGRLVVASGEPGRVTLLLDGVGVYAANGPALVVAAAEAVELRLAPDSYNTLWGGAEPSGDDEAALRSAAPLTVTGGGHLLLMSRRGHGVMGERGLTLRGGVLTVIAADHGLRGESLRVSGGDLLVFAAGDALKATGEGEGAGVVELSGGAVELVTGGDGVDAERMLLVSGGTVEVLAGGGHAVAPGEASTKGLKAGVELKVEGGAVRVDSSDDALHSDGDIRVTGGRLTLATGDDALHADGSLLVEGGSIEVTASREGLEAPRVSVTGGTVLVTADDDAINAAGDAPASELLIEVSGGLVVLEAGSDAIDSNGAVHLTGGTLVLRGPHTLFKPAIDRHMSHHVLLDGATVVAAGTLVVGQERGIDARSSQAVIYMNLDWPLPAGTVMSLRGEDGYLATFRAPEGAWRMSFTSPQVVVGAAYELWLGGEPLGAERPGGLFQPAGVSGGELRRLFRAR